MIDAEALAMYGRCVVFEQTKKVHYADLIQLVYLSLRRKRVLVTNDEPFRQAAQVILGGRYANAKVIGLRDII